jgi:hypothetical protein
MNLFIQQVNITLKSSWMASSNCMPKAIQFLAYRVVILRVLGRHGALESYVD